MTVTFDDGGTAGSVDLTIEATNLSHPEFVFNTHLNYDTALDLNDLVFSAPVKTGTFIDPTLSTGLDQIKADGDGFFDILIEFDHTDGPTRTFSDGESVTFTITDPGVDVITASSFDFLSTPDGFPGVFPVAAHIGGVGSNNQDSGWISVPEPTALALFGLGGLPLARRRR
ncbi:MAG: PEP-CTERM sorting domain-containing protein [bacterium]|nr:PEP-CTERM sorting domain-containing protein [bacterium]